MTNPVKSLKAVMDYFGITNSELSKAIAVDPSLVSRWLNGQRKLKASSTAMDALAEYILARSKRVQDIEWLKKQFEEGGLPCDISTVYSIKQNLIM
ncbi:MAG TPA: helix-turn-helix transcriptional regulator, partial [Bacillota bacterium]|nr:helix-turn-helix transcriptional regulator [Bacillota bacterium]